MEKQPSDIVITVLRNLGWKKSKLGCKPTTNQQRTAQPHAVTHRRAAQGSHKSTNRRGQNAANRASWKSNETKRLNHIGLGHKRQGITLRRDWPMQRKRQSFSTKKEHWLQVQTNATPGRADKTGSFKPDPPQISRDSQCLKQPPQRNSSDDDDDAMSEFISKIGQKLKKYSERKAKREGLI